MEGLYRIHFKVFWIKNVHGYVFFINFFKTEKIKQNNVFKS